MTYYLDNGNDSVFNTTNLNSDSYHCSWLIICKKCKRVISIDQKNISHECFTIPLIDIITETDTDINNDVDVDTSKGSKTKAKNKRQILDLDRHCGVLIISSGFACMRSLTCKSHSIGSKRAVIGRSQDIDFLINNSIKKNLKTKKSQANSKTNEINDFENFKSFSNYSPNLPEMKKFRWLSYNLQNWVKEPLKLYSITRKNNSSIPE